jgi:hypothetical protein
MAGKKYQINFCSINQKDPKTEEDLGEDVYVKSGQA